MHFIYGIALLTIFCLGTIAVFPTSATVPSTNPNLAVRFVNPNPGDARISLPDPQHITFAEYPPTWNGTVFNCTIYIENLDIGWAISAASFSVSYNASLTNIVGTTLSPDWSGTVDTMTPGIVNIAVTTTSSLSANVPVLTITFNIQGQHEITFVPPYFPGYSDVSEVAFFNTSLEGGVGPIPTNPAKNGFVTVYATPFRRPYDVMVTRLASSKSVVGQGFCSIVNVTGRNHGWENATFMVTAYANTTPIGSGNITVSQLFGPIEATISFVWNTTGLAKGNYLLSAYATPPPGDYDLSNNNLTGGWVKVAMVGDVTGPAAGVPDGKVDIRDLAAIAKCYGANYPDPRYDANCDLTGLTLGVADGKIDIRDIAVAAKNFGSVDP